MTGDTEKSRERRTPDWKIEVVCATLSVAALLQWDMLVGATWTIRHPELFASLAQLRTDVALINAFVGLSLYLLLRVLFAPGLAAGLGIVVGIGFAAASERKMQMLDFPLLPWDFRFSADLDSFITFLGLPTTVLLTGVALAALLAGLLLWRGRRRLIRKGGHVAALLAATITCFIWYRWIILPDTPRFLSGQIHNIAWDLGADYTNYGPYYTFLVNLKYLSLPTPTKTALAAARSLDAKPGSAVAPAGERPNLVVILSEAFTDLPKRIFGLPFTCLENAPIAQLVTPVWGGGTANLEFEILAGYPQALFPKGAVPFQMYVKRPMPQGLAHVFRDAGYEATAIHNYLRDFFSRPSAYEMLGFERYIGIEDLHNPPTRGQFADDEVIYRELRRQLDAPGDRPRFLHAVTMMAHLGYDWPGRYPIDPRLPPRLPQDLRNHELALVQYASMIYDGEAMFCHFIESLKQTRRRTLVLYFGDHYPSFGSMDIYRAVDKSLHGNVPFDLDARYTKAPLVLFDSARGFVNLPADVAGYNLGALLLREAGLTAQGIWAMPHKRDNVRIVPDAHTSVQRASIPGGSASRTNRHPELELLAAHLYHVLVEP
jgi:hypothetical protein